ncbi:MAG: hypothetical protein ABSC03_06505 [Verrucomicrobiota bacterium]
MASTFTAAAWPDEIEPQQDLEHAGAALANALALVGNRSEVNVSGEKRLGEDRGLAVVFFDAAIARPRHRKTFPTTIFVELLFAARARVRHQPEQIVHAFP